MNYRKNLFKSGSFWHICNKSISNYGIFKFPNNSQRFLETLDYYNNHEYKIRYSQALRDKSYKYNNLLLPKRNSFYKILSYCIMEDHYHLVIKLLTDDTLSKYINDIENSYTRFFNRKSNRKGPLWQSSFRAVLIESNEQLLHVIRYVNINPTTDYLVSKPEDWNFSSYRDLITDKDYLTKYIREISISNKATFKKFCEDNIDYQRKLSLIKHLLLE